MLAVALVVTYLAREPVDVVAPAGDGAAIVAEAYRQQESGLWVQLEGEVTRLLPDDNKGSRHQRFIVRLPDGQTLLVSHNIDLAERVPLDAGARVSLRGRYEWNPKGGVVHWTHHDPDGRMEGGWIDYMGTRVR